MLTIFLKTFFIGFSIAMPIGPIGLLCIKNTLSHGFKVGFAVGLGAALADSFYGFLAGGGLAIISKLLLNHITYIKFIGGIFLIYLGAREIRTCFNRNHNISSKATNIKSHDFLRTVSTVFLLTLTNPATIISFVAIFATVGNSSINNFEIFIMILGVFLGSLLWWLILAITVSRIKHKISEKLIMKIKIISGSFLIGFGGYALL